MKEYLSMVEMPAAIYAGRSTASSRFNFPQNGEAYREGPVVFITSPNGERWRLFNWLTAKTVSAEEQAELEKRDKAAKK